MILLLKVQDRLLFTASCCLSDVFSLSTVSTCTIYIRADSRPASPPGRRRRRPGRGLLQQRARLARGCDDVARVAAAAAHKLPRTRHVPVRRRRALGVGDGGQAGEGYLPVEV